MRIQARELGLPLDDPDGRPLSVGGGMTFGGGPLNNATFQALARMVTLLRDAPGTTGLLTFISGIITKHGTSVWSTTPPDAGLRVRRHLGATSRRAPRRSISSTTTTAPRSSTPTPSRTRQASRATRRCVARTSDDATRAWCATTTPTLAADMTSVEWCGREIAVDGDRFQPAS